MSFPSLRAPLKREGKRGKAEKKGKTERKKKAVLASILLRCWSTTTMEGESSLPTLSSRPKRKRRKRKGGS